MSQASDLPPTHPLMRSPAHPLTHTFAHSPVRPLVHPLPPDSVYGLSMVVMLAMGLPSGILFDKKGGRNCGVTGAAIAAAGLALMAFGTAFASRGCSWLIFLGYPLAIGGGTLNTYSLVSTGASTHQLKQPRRAATSISASCWSLNLHTRGRRHIRGPEPPLHTDRGDIGLSSTRGPGHDTDHTTSLIAVHLLVVSTRAPELRDRCRWRCRHHF